MRTTTLKLAAIMTAGLFLAACSSAPKVTPASTTAGSSAVQSTMPVKSTIASGKNAVSDQALANSLVLHVGDLPGAWTDIEPETESTSGDKALAACLQIPAFDPEQTAYAGSDQYALGMNSVPLIYSETYVYKTSATVQSKLDGDREKSYSGCEEAQAQAQAPGPLTKWQTTVGPLPSSANGIVGVAINFSYDFGGETAYQSIAILTRGRVEIDVETFSEDFAFPAATFDHATGAMAARLIDAGSDQLS